MEKKATEELKLSSPKPDTTKAAEAKSWCRERQETRPKP